VSQRKLEALESDAHDELQGVAFVRALAQAACRVLKVDAAPVLARLPQVEQRTLDRVSGGLNEPFREKGGPQDAFGLFKAGRGLLLLVGVLLLGAALLWLLPPGFSMAGVQQLWTSAAPAPGLAAESDAAMHPADSPEARSEPAPAPGHESAAPTPVAPGEAVASVAAAASPALISAPPLDAAPAKPTSLTLSARAASWIEVTDGKGATLLARTMTSGESLSLDAALPISLKIGNAAATEVRFRGKVVDLAPSTRDNVARIELK
jgi:cytoskeleton protein RodZ